MAKLGLIFLIVFLAVQISLAARIQRDTPSVAEGDAADPTKFFQDAFQKVSSQFTEKNLKDFMENVSEFGKKVGEAGSNFGKQLADKVQELGKKNE